MFKFSWWLRLTESLISENNDADDSWYLAIGLIHISVLSIIGILFIGYFIYIRTTEDGFEWDVDENGDDFVAAMLFFLGILTSFILWPVIYVVLVLYSIYYVIVRDIFPLIRRYKFKVKNEMKWKNETLEIIEED